MSQRLKRKTSVNIVSIVHHPVAPSNTFLHYIFLFVSYMYLSSVQCVGDFLILQFLYILDF